MKLTIDNLQGLGPIDYTAWLDETLAPHIQRLLNQPAKLKLDLIPSPAGLCFPQSMRESCWRKQEGLFFSPDI